MGAAGAALIRRERVVQATPPRVEVVNTVGSGDALLAGFLHGRASGMDDTGAVVFAVATGTASARQRMVGSVDVAEIDRLLPQVAIGSIAAGEYAAGSASR
jgi:fructose-1-phosphate kinase PfkB-like protein